MALKARKRSGGIDFGKMDLRDFVRLAGQEPLLPFLLIGGHAVAAHGHTRATFDVDFLVCQSDRIAWLEKLARSGLKLTSETTAFAQFTQKENGDGLDLMFVNQPTFDSLRANSLEKDFGEFQARIPSLDHLLALKLHALKQGLLYRTSKDAEDVEMLARRNQLDLTEPRYEQLFLKYGNREIYETILRVLRER